MSVFQIPATILLAMAPPASDVAPIADIPAALPQPADIASDPANTAPAEPSAPSTDTTAPAPPLASPADAPTTPDVEETKTGDEREIVVTARPKIKEDPLVGVNAASFSVLQSVDGALVAPISKAYEKAIPSPVRSGLRNVLLNLHQPIVFLNYVLQLKPGRAAETLGRFAINTTIGVGGLVDVAKKKPFNLPHRPNGFAFTLGYYGVKPGAFLYLPLIGPTTVRDMIGRTIDLAVVPFAVGGVFTKPYYSISTTAIRSLDERVQNDDKLSALKNSADPYAELRDAYLKKRQADIDELRSGK